MNLNACGKSYASTEPQMGTYGLLKVGCLNWFSGKFYEAEHYRRRFKLTPRRLEGIAEGTSVTQAFIKRLAWDNGYPQVVGKPTRGD